MKGVWANLRNCPNVCFRSMETPENLSQENLYEPIIEFGTSRQRVIMMKPDPDIRLMINLLRRT